MKSAKEKNQKRASFLRVLKTVCWGYLGVRSERGYQEDIAALTLGQIVAVGTLVCLLFVVAVASAAIYIAS